MGRNATFHFVVGLLILVNLVVIVSCLSIKTPIPIQFPISTLNPSNVTQFEIVLKNSSTSRNSNNSRIPLKTISLLSFFPLPNLPPPESFMTTGELITAAGYPVERHVIKTEDNYFLTIFRIPRGRGQSNEEDGKKREPILLQSGFFAYSVDWFLLPKSEALPFLLADQGYDVWVGNVRGSSENGDENNRQHEFLTVDDLEFWNFSFHEMGFYDTTSTISHILNRTGFKQILYICHSMGCAELAVAVYRDKSINEKIRKTVMLAPGFYITHNRSPILGLMDAPGRPFYLAFKNLFAGGRASFVKINELTQLLLPYFCSKEIPGELVCKNVVFLFAGFDRPGLTDETAIKVSGHFAPSHSSAKTFAHYSQTKSSDSFQNYDYGPEENLKRYGSTQPPLYNLTSVTVPSLVFYSQNDFVVVPQDAERVIRELGNVQKIIQVPDPLFNHVDFYYHKNAKTIVYHEILAFIN